MADQAAKEAAGVNQDTQGPAQPPPEPECLRILMATTKSIIRRTMRGEWDLSWETAKQGRDLFKLGVRPGKSKIDTRHAHRNAQSCQLCGHTDAHEHDQPRVRDRVQTRATEDRGHHRHTLLPEEQQADQPRRPCRRLVRCPIHQGSDRENVSGYPHRQLEVQCGRCARRGTHRGTAGHEIHRRRSCSPWPQPPVHGSDHVSQHSTS
ncbi:uncharacterized protein B0I36DRAFT_397127 [Microdochium trichocladiopsis]|uniref:Uncharacterized protein n=1 Tax=Microdochium trichocladiopsis TaxID=1682393 RepID=A0A9P8XV41_9PEZI|nr:uncharacterized protein B0I36DRAFT_397127 [Microdochium trichocladiopsis]KAH7016514.1 hypothetical protein B0I36DRAFT_397127 [Microdochium trichocladiopsis]